MKKQPCRFLLFFDYEEAGNFALVPGRLWKIPSPEIQSSVIPHQCQETALPEKFRQCGLFHKSSSAYLIVTSPLTLFA